MSLEGALNIAVGGLANINAQLAVVSQNIANAGTPGYAKEVANQQSLTAGGQGLGVHTAPATRTVDVQLQKQSWAQNSTTVALQTRQAALAGIDTALGATASGNDLPSLLGNLQSAFSTLLQDPSSQAQQSQVVTTAQTLAQNINALAGTYATARQSAQDSVVSDVATLNQSVSSIGQLTAQIQALKTQGLSTADLESQRDQVMQTVSGLVDMTFVTQSDGSLVGIVGGSTSVPLTGGTATFSMSPATLGPNASYPASAPGLMLNGVDITRQVTGGSIGANLTLRDTTLPTDQAQLDEFSENLATRFSSQGLTLFTDGAGAVPAGGGTPAQSGYVGLANSLQVNAAVIATPSLVRDGTGSIAGSPTGASAFTANPTGGPAGFTNLISRVVSYTFGAQVQDGVAQPASQASGLGPAGTLSAPYAPQATLAGEATAMVAAQSQDSAAASTSYTNAQAVQTALQTQVSNKTGVSVDAEMSNMIQLQNAYAANARVMAAIQQMWTDLMNTVSTVVG